MGANELSWCTRRHFRLKTEDVLDETHELPFDSGVHLRKEFSISPSYFKAFSPQLASIQ